MGAIPFWRGVAQVVSPLPDGQSGPPLVAEGSEAWDACLINGQRLPGLVKLTKAPPIALQEVVSKGKNKDSQVRTVRGLKSAPFTFTCTLTTAKHWEDWQAMLPLLLPVTRPDKRAEIRQITHPMIQSQGYTQGFVSSIDPIQVPDGGGPAVFAVNFQSWYPNADMGRAHTKTDKTQRDPVKTIDIAQSAPSVPTLSSAPTPGRLRDGLTGEVARLRRIAK